MSEDHHVAAIMPAKDIDVSEAFYRRLGLETVGDYGDYRLMDAGLAAPGRGQSPGTVSLCRGRRCRGRPGP
jgi:catechol 2,3-dioxygenase-like lactoylglutathione lyase family enzyme